MIIEHEGNFRITMNVEEALALQRDMSAELLRVSQSAAIINWNRRV